MRERVRTLIVVAALVAGCSTARPDISKTSEALSSCVTLSADADAMLSNPPMSQSFGTLPIMRAGGKDESLVHFDLGSIPSAAAINSATLKVYISGSGSDAPINAHRVTSPWTEPSVTYASFGQHFDPAVLAAFMTGSVNVQKSLDLTALVRSWDTGAQANFGVLLETASDKKTIFVTREGGTTEQKPQLQVCYSLPDDHCAPNPCLNGGTCSNNASSYTCSCAPGYSGANCDGVIDNCAGAPCLNGGACTNGVNGYTCACPPGYTGANCQTLVDNCAGNPCLNGGACSNGVDGYTCACPPGYTGANCQTLIDNCAGNPCLNGGACSNGVNSYACTCLPGFTGANCEININNCASQPCHNGGTCVDGTNSYTCSCPPDWGGPTCDVNLSSCSQSPCLNGGACTNGFGSYTCTCAAGYTGTNCEIDINDCAPNPCQNGGVCIDGVNAHSCACAPGYSGTNCQTAVDLCSPSNQPPVVQCNPSASIRATVPSCTACPFLFPQVSDPNQCGSASWVQVTDGAGVFTAVDLDGDPVTCYVDQSSDCACMPGGGYAATGTSASTAIPQTVQVHCVDSCGNSSPLVLCGVSVFDDTAPTIACHNVTADALPAQPPCDVSYNGCWLESMACVATGGPHVGLSYDPSTASAGDVYTCTATVSLGAGPAESASATFTVSAAAACPVATYRCQATGNCVPYCVGCPGAAFSCGALGTCVGTCGACGSTTSACSYLGACTASCLVCPNSPRICVGDAATGNTCKSLCSQCGAATCL
jgi:hypothetical protein